MERQSDPVRRFLILICLIFVSATTVYADTVAGRFYSDEGVTAMSAGMTIAVAINGFEQGATNDTDASGNFSITGLTLNAGDVLSVYVEDEVENGVLITVSDGNDLTNANLYQDHLIIRHDNGGSMTNALLATAYRTGLCDDDINGAITTSGTTVTVGNGFELFIAAGHTMNSTGDVVIGNGGLDLNGTWTATGSEVITIKGDIDLNGGVWNSASETFYVNSTVLNRVAYFSGQTLYDFVLDASSATRSLTIHGSVSVHNYTQTLGRLNAGTAGNINVSNSIAIAGGDNSSSNDALLTVNGTGPQAISSTSGWAPSITVNKSSGTLTFLTNVSSVGPFTHAAGAIDFGTTTFTIGGQSATTTFNNTAINNLTFESTAANQIFTISGAATVKNLVVTLGNINQGSGGDIAVSGNLTFSSGANSVNNDALVTISGTGAQALSASGWAPYLLVNKVSGTLTMSSDVAVAGSFVHTAGTIDFGSTTFTLGGDSTDAIFNNTQFYNLALQKIYNYRRSLVQGTAVVGNNFSIFYGGIEDAGGEISVRGNLIIAAAGGYNSSPHNAKIVIDGTGNQAITHSDSAGGELPSLEIDKASGTLTVATTLNINGAFRHTQGSIDFGTNTVVLRMPLYIGSLGYYFNNTNFYNLTVEDSKIASDRFAVHGTAIVQNNLSLAPTNLDAGTAGEIRARGNISFLSTFGQSSTLNDGIIIIDGTGTQTVTYATGAILPHLTINQTNTTDVVDFTGTGPIQLYEDLTITRGTLDINNLGLTLEATSAISITNNGTLRMQGGNSLVFGAGFDTDSGTVVVDGTSSVTLSSGITQYYNLTLDESGANNPTFTLPDSHVTISGVLRVADATLAFDNDKNLTISGGGGAGTALIVDAAGTLLNVGTGDLMLAANVSNAGTITFNAVNTADAIVIASNTTAARDWSGAGTFFMQDVSVSYQTANSGTPASITAYSSTDSGNNNNWLFPRVDVSGRLFSDEGTTAITSGRTIAISINGVEHGATVETDGSGNYSFTGLDIVFDDVVALYVEDETENAISITVANGLNLTAIDLYQDHVLVRHHYGSSISNAHLDIVRNGGTADNDVTAAISVDGSDNVVIANGYELFIATGNTFRSTANVVVGNGGLDLNGSWTVSGGESISVAGPLDFTGGIWNAASETFSLASSGGNYNVTFDGQELHNLVINGDTANRYINLSGTVTVNDYTQTQGNINAGTNGNIEVRGNLVFVGGEIGTTNDGLITINGTAAQTITSSAACIAKITVDKASGTLNVLSDISIEGGFIHQQGAIDFGATTLSVIGSSSTLTFNNTELYNLTISKSSGVQTLSGTAIVQNDLTLILGALNGMTDALHVEGDIIVASGFGENSANNDAEIVINGTGAQSITHSDVAGAMLPALTIDKAAGTLSVATSFGIVGDFSHVQGAIDFATTTISFLGSQNRVATFNNTSLYNVVFAPSADATKWLINGVAQIANDLTLNEGELDAGTAGDLRVAGDLAVAATFGAAATSNDALITLNGSGTQQLTFATGGILPTVTVNQSATSDVVAVAGSGPVSIYENFTMTQGIFDLNGLNLTLDAVSTFSMTNNATLRLEGGETVTFAGPGGFDEDSGSVVFNGSASYAAGLPSGFGDQFYNLTFDGIGATWTVDANTTVANNFTATAGTLDINDYTFAINGNAVVNGGTVATGTNTVTFGDAGGDTVTISAGELRIESDVPNSDIVVNAGTWTNSGGTIAYRAGSVVAQGLLAAQTTYHNLTINSLGSSYVLPDANIVVNGVLTVTAGTLAFDDDKNLTVNDTAASGTAIAIASNGVFSNNATGDLLLGGNISNSGAIVFDSSDDVGDAIAIASTAGERQWQGVGSFSLIDVTVTNQSVNVTAPQYIVATSATDGGGNTNWIFSVGAMTSATVSLASSTASAPTDATISFTSAHFIPSDGKIIVDFPAGFDLSGISGASSAGDIDGSLAVGVTGQSVTLTRSGGTAIAAATAIDDLIIANVINPASDGVTGSFTLSSTTSSDAIIDTATAAGATIIATHFNVSASTMIGADPLTGVTLTSSALGNASTNGSGVHNYGAIAVGSAYVITPSKTGYIFSPTSIAVANLSGNQSHVFSATALFSVSGTIRQGAVGVAGVAIDGGALGSTTTNSSGAYSFTGIVNGTNYSITPSKSGFTFTPSVVSGTISGSSVVRDITAVADGPGGVTVSGRVLAANLESSPVIGVTVSNGLTSDVTDANGDFSLSGVADGSYQLIAQKANFKFDLVSGSNPVVVSGADVEDLVFQARRAPGKDVYAMWNGFLNSANVVEILNYSETEPLVVALQILSSAASAANTVAQKNFLTIPPMRQIDVVVNDLPGFEVNSYGVLSVHASHSQYDGRLSVYRPKQFELGQEFGYAIPFTSPTAGDKAFIFNTYYPGLINVSEKAVDQWLTIANTNASRAASFLVEKRDITGALLSQETVTVAPRSRFDLEAGHVLPGYEMVGLVRVVPMDASLPYFAQLNRYAFDKVDNTFDFAVSLSPLTEQETKLRTVFSNPGNAFVFAEIANTRESEQAVEVIVRGDAGEVIWSKTEHLAPYAQAHLRIDTMLEVSSSGVIELNYRKPGAFIAYAMTYIMMPGTDRIVAAYESPLRDSYGKKMYGSFNLFLDMANLIRIGNLSDNETTIRLHVGSGGALNASSIVTIAPHATTEIQIGGGEYSSLSDANSYGLVSVETSSNGAVIPEMIRLGNGPEGYEFGMSTQIR